MRSSLSMPSSNTPSSAFHPALPTPPTLLAIHSSRRSGTDIIDERFFLDRALEQFKNLAQTQMNDGVKRLAFDFLSGKPGIVFQQNCFAGQAIAQNAAAFFGF